VRVFVPRFLGALAYLLGVTVVGVLGYMAIEGWQAQEALYMTVITITAVGFSEVYPLSELGRNFTMVLLAAGITGIGVVPSRRGDVAGCSHPTGNRVDRDRSQETKRRDPPVRVQPGSGHEVGNR